MRQSSNQGNFFETDAAQAKRETRAQKSQNKNGDPIQLNSKINAAVVDPSSPLSCIYVAASSGWIRKVNVDTKETSGGHSAQGYTGPNAPITCVAVGGPENKYVFGGSWNKILYCWEIAKSSKPVRTYEGHSDFVKAVVCGKIGGKHVVVTGGSDKKIIVWDMETTTRLHTLQDPVIAMLAIQDLVIDPVDSTSEKICLVSASSDPHIRRWNITLDSWEKVVENSPDAPGSVRHSILEHETSVYKLVFDREGDEIDLWTSSADGTTKCLSRLRNFATEDTYEHGDYVRAVALTDQWVITAGRDENVKVWDRSSGKLYLSFDGHYNEVTDLVILQGVSGNDRVTSVSIDGTVRTWPLAKSALDEIRKRQQDDAQGGVPVEEEEKRGGMLTAEEEAELAALMDDDN